METPVQKIASLLLKREFISLFESDLSPQERRFLVAITTFSVTGFHYKNFCPSLDLTLDGTIVLMWQSRTFAELCTEQNVVHEAVIACPISETTISFSRIEFYSPLRHEFYTEKDGFRIQDFPQQWELLLILSKKVNAMKNLFQEFAPGIIFD